MNTPEYALRPRNQTRPRDPVEAPDASDGVVQRRSPVPSAHAHTSGAREFVCGTGNAALVEAVVKRLLLHSGLTAGEAGKRMGATDGSDITHVVHQNLSFNGRCKRRASFEWMVNFAAICGARFTITFPDRPLV